MCQKDLGWNLLLLCMCLHVCVSVCACVCSTCPQVCGSRPGRCSSHRKQAGPPSGAEALPGHCLQPGRLHGLRLTPPLHPRTRPTGQRHPDDRTNASVPPPHPCIPTHTSAGSPSLAAPPRGAPPRLSHSTKSSPPSQTFLSILLRRFQPLRWRTAVSAVDYDQIHISAA